MTYAKIIENAKRWEATLPVCSLHAGHYGDCSEHGNTHPIAVKSERCERLGYFTPLGIAL